MAPSFELPQRIASDMRGRLMELATQQDGVARRDQLSTLGVSRKTVEAMLNAARWRAHGVVVIAMHNGPLTRRQQLWAAVLNAGDVVGLAARTAAAQHGLVGWAADCIEILVVKGTCVPGGLGIDVKIHESRRFCAADLHVGRAGPAAFCAPPCSSGSRLRRGWRSSSTGPERSDTGGC